MTAIPTTAPAPYWTGHRPGAALLIGCETLIRTAFFGFQTIIVLFLSQPVLRGGFGWTDGEAIRMAGVVIGLFWIVPLMGAWIGTRHLSPRRCIGTGFLLSAVGYGVIGLALIAPDIDIAGSGATLRALSVEAGLSLARLDWASAGDALTIAAGGDPGLAIPLYAAISLLFYGGIFCLFMGGGLATVHVSTCFGQLFDAHGRRSEKGFSYMYMGVNLALLVGTIVVAGAGERLGWQYSLLLAASICGFSWVIYRARVATWLGEVGREIPVASHDEKPLPPMDARERAGLKALLLVGAIAIIFYIPDGQSTTSISLFIESSVERTVAGMEVPVSWFQALNPIYSLLLGLMMAPLAEKALGRGRTLGLFIYLAAAFLMIGAAFGLVSAAQAQASDTVRSPVGWTLTALFLIAFAELLVIPTLQALVSRIAPRRYAAYAMSGFFIVFGLGLALSGLIGGPLAAYGSGYLFMTMMAICVVGIAALLLVARPVRQAIITADGE